ncbi:MAG TPA: ThiF family adenylyltransferase [Candidatus Acidoferrum sp.]|nr:ThiF family adenylyltransferase [Candidatus Acidoferrum sp.]
MKFDLGNRHQGNLDGKLLNPAGSSRVRIIAGTAFAQTQGGQHLLWMLVNLLARQYGVVAGIEIAVPAVELNPFIAPFGRGPDLQTALADMGRLVAAGQMDIRTASPPDERRCASIECVGVPISTWSATADGWNLHVGPGEVPEALPSSSLSIGPYFAACILASEVFKTVRGYDASRRCLTPVAMSLWAFQTYDDVSQAPKAPTSIGPIPLPYLVGAGAVGQALAATFVTSRIGPPAVIVIDGDVIDEELTNLNRYCLAVPSDKNRNKAELISEHLTRAGLRSFPFPLRWADYVQSGVHAGIAPHIRAAEREGRYEYIISCVDTNPSRHDLQRMWPRLIIGGSTNGMGATVEVYNLGFGHECLMCSNPLDGERWTLEGEIARLQQLSDAERQAEALRIGVEPVLLTAYLRNPKCGALGEAELRRFQPSSSRHDWSVGFVSVGAGVMLAAVLLRYFSAPADPAQPPAFRFSFETNRPRTSQHRPSPECECRKRGLDEWRRLWP